MASLLDLMAQGVCLNSQQIRQCIKEGRIKGRDIQESQIQPSSFDPRVSNELFILDRERGALFKPERFDLEIHDGKYDSVYGSLMKLPRRGRMPVDITGGFELKRGFTYLVRLEERITVNQGGHLRFSPKSTIGRLFLDTRAVCDFNPCYDETHWRYSTGELQMWLLLQPLAFNLVLHPGDKLNQLRVFPGDVAKLTPGELTEEFARRPFLFRKGLDDKLEPVNPIISDDILVHLNLSGKYSEGVVGFRAIANPMAMDLSKDAEYPTGDYYEPLVNRNGRVDIRENEHYLLSTEEILVIPEDRNVELMMHSNIGLRGELHFAGFADNCFEGDLVLEVRSSERTSAGLRDGMPISKLEVFRTEKPDKVYGKGIGSHYFGQVGPKPPKICRPFNYAYAARNLVKLNRDVLCQDRKLLMAFRKSGEGFESGGDLENLLRCVSQGIFHSRYDCDPDPATDSGGDELAPQVIPYVLIFGPNETVFRYVRAEDIKDYGEHTLFGKHSIGVGGHINRDDAPNYVPRNIEREIDEEVRFLGIRSEPRFIGTLVSSRKPVDRVHFGLVYAVYCNGEVVPRESSINSGKLFSMSELASDTLAEKKFETWSHLLLGPAGEIYNANLDLMPR